MHATTCGLTPLTAPLPRVNCGMFCIYSCIKTEDNRSRKKLHNHAQALIISVPRINKALVLDRRKSVSPLLARKKAGKPTRLFFLFIFLFWYLRYLAVDHPDVLSKETTISQRVRKPPPGRGETNKRLPQPLHCSCNRLQQQQQDASRRKIDIVVGSVLRLHLLRVQYTLVRALYRPSFVRRQWRRLAL